MRRSRSECNSDYVTLARSRASANHGVARRPGPVSMYQSLPLREYQPYFTVRLNLPMLRSQVMNTSSIGMPPGRQWPDPCHTLHRYGGKGGFGVASISFSKLDSRAFGQRQLDPPPCSGGCRQEPVSPAELLAVAVSGVFLGAVSNGD